MKNKLEDVHAIAEAYLIEIGATNIPRVIHGTRSKQSYYGENLHQFTTRVEAERERRYEVADIPETFVLQSGKKFFYGFKGDETKWTYDRNLAFKFNRTDVDIAINDLESLGFSVTKFPVLIAESSL
jgi:hypothetical protein